MPVVVWFLRWTVRSCDFKRVGEWLFPEQSRSWLRHSNPCAPNHTALLSARGYNQGNTSKFSLWSWFVHTRAYNMCRHVNRNTFIEPLANCTWILGSMTHNGSAIRSLSLALNQTLLRLVCGNGAFNCSPSTCLFAWSHLRDGLWASCPPECQYLLHPPPAPTHFCQLFQLLIYTPTFLLLLVVQSCVTSVGIQSNAWAGVQNQCAFYSWIGVRARVSVCLKAFLIFAQLEDPLMLSVIACNNVVQEHS